MKQKVDKKGKFLSYFDSRTGFYYRTDVIENGKFTGKDPFMAEFPELLDIGIMGHCIHGKSGLCLVSGVQCYQNGLDKYEENMSVSDFKSIVKQCKGRVFQFALGGRGDPDQHEYFEEILKICKENDIVANFTSSGLGFNDRIVSLCKKYCGAVAISWYRSDYTIRAIEMLLEKNVKTNIHYVLADNTIDEAIDILQNGKFPERINAIIFLLHKPIGLGEEKNMLVFDDIRVKEFFGLIDKECFPYKIGFDSCSVSALLRYTKNITMTSLDTCEGGRWSAYISPNMKMLPCSFDSQDMHWSVDLRKYSIQQAWESNAFEDFRNRFKSACPKCEKREYCMGGCPICPSIVLCDYK